MKDFIRESQALFVKKYSIPDSPCFPSPDQFSSLVLIDELPLSVYLTVNVNMRDINSADKKIIGVISRLLKCNYDRALVEMPFKNLHCSLLNFVTCPKAIKIKPWKVIEKLEKGLKNKIQSFKLFKREYEFIVDYLYFDKQSIALQVFIEQTLFLDLIAVKRELDVYFKGLDLDPFVIVENKIKLYPSEEEPRWGAMNLIRFGVPKLPDSLANDISKYIFQFNEHQFRKTHANENNCFCKIRLTPKLVISDHLFSRKSKVIADVTSPINK